MDKINILGMTSVILTLLFWDFTLCSKNMLVQKGNILEYCQGDFFAPSCSEDEVIVITSARYGHIQLGNCLDTDLGHFGCSAEKLQYLDQECSAKKQCNVLVSDTAMSKDVPCSSSLMKYLEASFTCIKVHTVTAESCQSTPKVTVRSRINYLTSFATKDFGCGEEGKPWTLEAKPGQLINISMIDFSWRSQSSIHAKCPVRYGYLIDVAQNQVTEICGGADRFKHVHISKGSEVQIVVDTNQLQRVSFVLSYQAIGCPTYISPKETWIKKEDNVIIVGCHGNAKTWKMRCIGNNWIGLVGSCSKAVSSQESDHIVEEKKEIMGMSPVVAFSLLGSVFFIILCVTVTLVVGIFCIKKPKPVKSEYYLTPTMCQQTLLRDGNYPTIRLVDRRMVNTDPSHTTRGDHSGILGQTGTPHYFALENREEQQSEPIYDAVYQNT